jgi:hypothetical protein
MPDDPQDTSQGQSDSSGSSGNQGQQSGQQQNTSDGKPNFMREDRADFGKFTETSENKLQK